MINNDLAIDRLQDLILTSVNLTEWQKEQIREAIRLLGGRIIMTKVAEYGYNWEDQLKGAVFIGELIFDELEFNYGTEGRISKERLDDLIRMFHAEEVYLHTEDDEWWMGIRANHFAVEIGTTEYSLEDLGLEDLQKELDIREYENYASDGTIEGESPQFCLVTGNHKGMRMTTVWLLKETMKYQEQTGIAHEETV